jgi:choline dehydrogenase-like flavoprotein
VRRVVLLAVAVAAAVTAFLLWTSPGAEPVRLSRSGVTVRLDGARTGTVGVQVDVPTRVTAVSVFATMPTMGHMTPEIDATQQEPGTFAATGELFSMPGVWELTVRVDGTVVTFDVIVG